jgi:hypothetical protein
MDISGDEYKSDIHQPGSFFVVLQNARGFINRLLGYFTLTEEDRLEAGIDLNSEGREE